MDQLADPRTPTVLRQRDLKRLGIGPKELRAALESGKLLQVTHGLYYNPAGDITEKHSFAEVACLAPQATFCLISALAFHQLTTQSHSMIWIAVSPKAHVPAIGFLEVRTMRFSGKMLAEGVETHLVEGVPVRVYSPAKTIADLFRDENGIGIDVAMEALEDAWLQRRVTKEQVLHFARICKVEEVVRPYLEDLASRKNHEIRWGGR